MLNRSKGHVVLGGQVDPTRRKLDITVVKDVQVGDSLLEDEIFGPVLAIVPVDVSLSWTLTSRHIKLTPKRRLRARV